MGVLRDLNRSLSGTGGKPPAGSALGHERPSSQPRPRVVYVVLKISHGVHFFSKLLPILISSFCGFKKAAKYLCKTWQIPSRFSTSYMTAAIRITGAA